MTYIEKKELTVLIVTYAKRWEYLKISLQHLLSYKQYIANVILVQNGNDYNLQNYLTAEHLDELSLKLIVNQNNEGSAGGFGIGIETAQQVRGKYLLILDDDNFLPVDSFENLQALDHLKLSSIYGKKIAVSLYRPDHDQNPEKFTSTTYISSDSYSNTVCDFSILHKIKRKSYLKTRAVASIAESFSIPYSGLLIEKQLLNGVEPVQRNYYLYGDDTLYTLRLSQAGVRFLTFQNIYSRDLERSWYQSDNQVVMSYKNSVDAMLHVEKFADLMRPFYQIRNAVNTSNTVLKTKPVLYFLNYYIYLIIPFFVYMPKNKMGIRNYKVFWKAMTDGQRGRLGKSNLFR